MSRIETDESNLIIFWRIVGDDGSVWRFFATPLTDTIGRQVLGNATDEYALVGFLYGTWRVMHFLRGVFLYPAYLANVLNVPQNVAELIAALLPDLTSFASGDLIIQAYDDFRRSHPNFTLVE